MIDKQSTPGYVTDSNGNELEIEIILEFEREENGKRFVIYKDKYPENDEDQDSYFVAEIVTVDDGSEEIIDIEDEDDVDYCQKVFDEFIDEIMSQEMGDEEEIEETIVS